nr:hypothetical protein [Tanacetum cinerariifolium]
SLIKCSLNIPLVKFLLKSKGKGSQGKKTVDTSEADVDVSEESDSKPARKQTSSRRVIKKKVTIFTDDNIILELDVDLELGKSISLTKPTKEKASRYFQCVKEEVSGSVSEAQGCSNFNPEEQLAANIMKALKESKKTSRRHPSTGGSNKGAGISPGVPDESIFVLATSSKGTEEEKDDDNDDKSINVEKTDDEETNDEFVHSEENVQDDDEETDDELLHVDEQVNVDEVEEMTNAEDA